MRLRADLDRAESLAGGTSASVRVAGADVDLLDMPSAIERVLAWAAEPGPTKLVVTPNIQHIDLLTGNRDFRDAYAEAELILPDGWPVAAVAGLVARRKVARVAGSDLAGHWVAAAASAGISVGFFGGAGDNAAVAATRSARAHPGLIVAQVEPMTPQELTRSEYPAQLRERMVRCAPQIVLLGLGAPKQEVFANQHLRGSAARVVLCVGASLDFLAGAKRRAPHVWQRLGLEWLWRLLLEPKRLAGRYSRAAVRFPLHVLGGLRGKSRAAEGQL
jgi:N-acetylglucosaminyldiphosphoundecaprenol N-acetyl-beta-D-mannosaminyltransferase